MVTVWRCSGSKSIQALLLCDPHSTLMKALASPPHRGTHSTRASNWPPEVTWQSLSPNPGLPKPMPDPAPGHLHSQNLEIKAEAVSQRRCHHWKDVVTVTLQPWALPPPSCLLAFLSVPKGTTGPTLVYCVSPGSRGGVLLWEGREMRGTHRPHCPEVAVGTLKRDWHPEAMPPSVPQGAINRPRAWLSPYK